MELQLDYFEQVTVSPELTLLRIGGEWEDGFPTAHPVLIVVNGSERRDVAALPSGAGDDLTEEWHAAFGVPAGAVRRDTLYRLDVGREIPLPVPAHRAAAPAEPALVEPRPEAAAIEEPAAAEPAAVRSEAPESERPAPPAAPVPARRAEPISVAHDEPLPPARAAFRRLLGFLFAALVIGLAGAWIAGAFSRHGGGGADTTPQTTATALRPRTSPRAGVVPVALTPLPGIGSGAAVAARLRGDRLTLDLRGLGAGVFQVWAYNSILDSVPLGASFRGPARTVAVRVPAGNGYRYIDVSREGDENPGHSGRSVVRVAIAALRRSAASVPGG